MLSDDIYDKLFEYASFKGKKKDFKGMNKKITKKNNNKGNKEAPKKQTKRKLP